MKKKAEKQRCLHVTTTGTSCKNYPRRGTGMCKSHGKRYSKVGSRQVALLYYVFDRSAVLENGSIRDFETKHGRTYYKSMIDSLVRNGFIEVSDGFVSVTEKGEYALIYHGVLDKKHSPEKKKIDLMSLL